MFAIQGKQLVVEQQFHFVHGLFDAFWGKLTFPDDDHLPTVFLKHLVVFLVAFSVAINFVLPEIHIGLGQPVFVTTLMSMPEAPVDKDGRVVFPHDDIWFPWHAFHVEPIAVTVCPQPLPHLQLGFGVPTADVRHHEVPLGWGENIGHLLSQLFEMQSTAFFQ